MAILPPGCLGPYMQVFVFCFKGLFFMILNCVYACGMYMEHRRHRGEKRVSDPLELEL